MPVDIEFADRLKELPPYLFLEIDRAKREAVAQGRDVINLGVGDPDQPTPSHIVEALKKAAEDGVNHHYAFDAGMPELRNEIACWFRGTRACNIILWTVLYPKIEFISA